MASLQDLDLPPDLRQRLLARGVRTARDCLHHSVTDLAELLDLPHSAASALLLSVSAQSAPGYVTAAQLYSLALIDNSSQLRTFLPDLDAALRVGVPPGAITELVGPAGVGKSQMAMGLALSAALPRELQGLGVTAMYIDTEGKLSVARMQEMALARAARAFAEQPGPPAPPGAAAAPAALAALEELAMSALDRVLIVRAATLDALHESLAALERQVPQTGARLVVLDSVAALLRGGELGGGREQMLERSEHVGRQAAALKVLAERHRIPVVVTNQVTARPTGPAAHAFQGGGAAAGGGEGEGDGHNAAALGTKWAHGVNVRLVLERQGARRFIKIAKSPISPNLAFEYAITAAGAQQVGCGPVTATDGAAQVGGSVLALPIVNQPAPEGPAWDGGGGGGWGGDGGGY
ncbi:DNA repair protein RAD51 [Raphidocelis subcapitata]|uniref:DNA repair protein RAD51 n=1 Tax=Raphidocelis subcapitata TaxID=307507 RepID=A0A2V0PME3_9CHLO|nr:DNA repair protein RAD51 [Raphidocelis subcapitata]|eukprot:GBF98527.1 DNA repair protein RAD51 [Raphidocelis subcapitata]